MGLIAPPLSTAGGRCLPGPPRGSDGRMAEAGGLESIASRCLDESSDSEPEQEPGSPQKLIRKVSTSGQIRSKVLGGQNLSYWTLSPVSDRLHSAGLGHTETRSAPFSSWMGPRTKPHYKTHRLTFLTVGDNLNLRCNNSKCIFFRTNRFRFLIRHILCLLYFICYISFDTFPTSSSSANSRVTLWSAVNQSQKRTFN